MAASRSSVYFLDIERDMTICSDRVVENYVISYIIENLCLTGIAVKRRLCSKAISIGAGKLHINAWKICIVICLSKDTFDDRMRR